MMNTLHEIANEYANKQPGMYDALTEDSPIVDVCKWQPATHGMWNVAEKMVSIDGPGFVEADAPLPVIRASSELVHTDLSVMGGKMYVAMMVAQKFKGPEAYFARHQDRILKDAGTSTEKRLVMDMWLKGARAVKNLRDAGGTSQGWFILAVRFDEHANVGLYDPDQFDTGRLFKITLLNGGEPYELKEKGYEGSIGYGIAYHASFGWQLLDPSRTVSAVVNIDETAKPTAAMIDDALADVRATPGNTYLFMSPRAKTYGVNPHKAEHVMLVNNDNEVKTVVDTWNGIPIITSYNIEKKIAKITVAS